MVDVCEFQRWSEQLFEEMTRGVKKYGPYASRHEAYAVIREELDELWDEIKRNAPDHVVTAEALQVAATALRLCLEIDGCVRDRGQ